MTDEGKAPGTGARRSRYSFMRPQFCLGAAILLLAVAFYGGIICSSYSYSLSVPVISAIVCVIVSIWGSVIGLVRWSKGGRSARVCTIIMLVALALLAYSSPLLVTLALLSSF